MLVKTVSAALLFSSISLVSQATDLKDPCRSIVGSDQIDTELLQAECYQAQRGKEEERRKWLTSRKENDDFERELKQLREESSPATKQQETLPAKEANEPEWPVVLYTLSAGREGLYKARIQYSDTFEDFYFEGDALPRENK